MTYTFTDSFFRLGLVLAIGTALFASANAQESDHEHDHVAGDVELIDGGENADFLSPSIYIFGTLGAFEPGADPSDFATTEHDPLNEAGIQAVEFDLGVNINNVLTGLVAGFVYQDSEHQWRGEFEESFLHYHFNESVTFGGGQFLNTAGFQNSRHTHEWEFINQNLVQSRILNEGHLTTQGGEILIRPRGLPGLITIGGGGVRVHEGGHDEEEHGHKHGHDEFELHGANLNSYVFSFDYRFALPQNPETTLAVSCLRGDNMSGGLNEIYGLGIERVWNVHAQEHAGHGFETGSLMLRSEFLARNAEVFLEDGGAAQLDDYGVTTSLHYGLFDRATLSLRHDWTSDIKIAEAEDTQRISPAFSYQVGAKDQGMVRFQYDYVSNSTIESEHVGWLQFRLQLGHHGDGQSH